MHRYHTLYSRSEFELAQEPVDDPVERARRFLLRQRMSRSRLGEWWSYSLEDLRRNMASVVRRWHGTIERLFVRLSAHPRRAI
jgi:hypothetical protein